MVLGPEITFILVYLIPVAWVTWFSGRTSGYVLALISTVGWFSVLHSQNPYVSLQSWGIYLNIAIKFLLFTAFAYVFSVAS